MDRSPIIGKNNMATKNKGAGSLVLEIVNNTTKPALKNYFRLIGLNVQKLNTLNLKFGKKERGCRKTKKAYINFKNQKPTDYN